MSGLAGYAFLEGIERSAERLRLRLAAAAFSGPNHGVEVHAEPGFGAVVASRFTGGGDAPSRSYGGIQQDGRYVLACEGYIVNLPELAGTAAAQAKQRERALIDLYLRGGDTVFAKLNGGFSLALWDRAEKRLALALSKLGTRRLYHLETGGGLVFGSEVKALPLLAGGDRTATRFRGVRRYLPGSIGCAQRGSHRISVPELLPAEREPAAPDLAPLTEELDWLLGRAVERLAGVHPDHAVLLGSDVDSDVGSALIAAYVRRLEGRVRTVPREGPDGVLPLRSLTRAASRLARTFLDATGSCQGLDQRRFRIGSALAQAMGAEALYPFLDDDVALFFSSSVPGELKTGEGTRRLLQELLQRHPPFAGQERTPADPCGW
jgi:asparagine synthetase B (glutamine-hydrolysing)